MTESKDLDPGAFTEREPGRATESFPGERDGHDMRDVIEGPVGSASIVDPGAIPERKATLPELGLEDAVPPETESH